MTNAMSSALSGACAKPLPIPINGHRYAASIVIPVYNEEAILEQLMSELHDTFAGMPCAIEFLICENGSNDGTGAIAGNLSANHQHVRSISLGQPRYGAAIRMGIMQADADIVVIFNADLWDAQFFERAVELLADGVDLVVGSKRLPESLDERPRIRRTITAWFNGLLRFAFGYSGTDTHGIKAVRRSRIVPILERCVTQREVFDTEFVLRAQRAGLVIRELPIHVADRRAARLSLLKRAPATLFDLVRIWRTL